MKTVVTTSPHEAAVFIKNGGIVAFPTETVYGLGANVFDPEAVAKIFEAKRRPADNPLIAHISDLSHIDDLASEIKENARKFIDAFFPGPLTLVLPKSDRVPLVATAGLDTIDPTAPYYALCWRVEPMGTDTDEQFRFEHGGSLGGSSSLTLKGWNHRHVTMAYLFNFREDAADGEIRAIIEPIIASKDDDGTLGGLAK